MAMQNSFVTLSNISALALIVIALGCPVLAYVTACRRHIRRLASRLFVYLLGLAPMLYLIGDSVYWHRQEDKLVAAILAIPPGSRMDEAKQISHSVYTGSTHGDFFLLHWNNPTQNAVIHFLPEFVRNSDCDRFLPRCRFINRNYMFYSNISIQYSMNDEAECITTPSFQYRPNEDKTGWVIVRRR